VHEGKNKLVSALLEASKATQIQIYYVKKLNS
jgi:hypothetical protein